MINMGEYRYVGKVTVSELIEELKLLQQDLAVNVLNCYSEVECNLEFEISKGELLIK